MTAIASAGPSSATMLQRLSSPPQPSPTSPPLNTTTKLQIAKLKKEHERMKEDLALETRSAKLCNNVFSGKAMSRLQDQGELYARKIIAEKKRLEDTEVAIASLHAQLNMQKREIGSRSATSVDSAAHAKHIRVLENRLDKALVKFNEALAYNKSLRETIENLRRERLVFDGIYRKLERELSEKKTKLNAVIDASNAAYEARDAAQSEMAALKAQADVEQQNFAGQWQALAENIEQDRRIKEFSGTAGPASPSSSGTAGKLAFTTGSSGHDVEASLRKRVTKGAWTIARDKASIHLCMERVQAYEEAFAAIQKATALADIDELVNTFVAAEDHNFALFNALNGLAGEEEKVDEEIDALRKELAALSSAGKPTGTQSAANDGGKSARIVELEAQQAFASDELRRLDEAYQTSVRVLSAVREELQNVHQSILGPDAGDRTVTDENALEVLGDIEEKTTELLKLHDIQRELVDGNGDGSNIAVRIGNGPVGSSAAVSIAAPTTLRAGGEADSDDDEDDEDDDDDDVQAATALAQQVQAQLSRQHA